MIRNPILPGFNPDPSILRVGEDYYIATSTFEWFPGVQIHHSRDLESWRLLTRPLRRASQLDMRGDPDSCGIWAPCLSHDGERFHLIYTDVKRYGRTTTGGAAGASLRDFHAEAVNRRPLTGWTPGAVAVCCAETSSVAAAASQAMTGKRFMKRVSGGRGAVLMI